MSFNYDFSNNVLQQQNISDMIYYYNKNMMAYHNNIENLTKLLHNPSTNIQGTNTRGDYNWRTTNSNNYRSSTNNNVNTNPFSRMNSRNRTSTTRSNSARSGGLNTPSSSRSNADIYRSFFTFIPLSTRTNSNNDLSVQHIEESTETIPYNDDLSETRCPISFEDFVLNENITKIKGCGHYFKTASLMDWLRRSSHCPVCRYDLRDYNNNIHVNDNVDPTPIEEEITSTSTIDNEYRTEISSFLESIIRNIDNDLLSTSFDFSNNQFVAEYSIDL